MTHDRSATAIRYSVRASRRARRLSVTVRPGGEVVVIAPHGVTSFAVERFVRAHAGWIARAIRRMAGLRDHVFLPRTRRSYLRHKEEARRLVHALLLCHAPRRGLRYGKVFVKDLRRNWGSCSERGNLNFNYKLALLPAPLAEYVVVHELCHLAHFDHSPRFWALVESLLPDHRERRKALQRYHA